MDEEVWRYSRIGELDLDARRPVSEPGAGDLAAVSHELEAIGDPVALVHLVDGHLVDIQRADDGGRVVVRGLEDGDQALLGSVTGEAHDYVTLLNEAFTPTPILIQVAAGADAPGPVVVVNQVVTPNTLGCSRIVVDAGADSSITVVELQVGGAAGALSVPLTEVAVGPAARVGNLVVQDLDHDTWQLGRQVSSVDADGSFTSAVAAFGGDYARLRTDCRLVGRGADGTLLAGYLGVGDQMLDFRTFQDHAAPDTTSDLVFKGALSGASQSVYTGLIRVRPDGRGTNAFQTNRNLKLSDDAWAESVPNLEIENNEVHCSHASTVGPVDEEQRFYLESRGVPPHQAEQLVVAGFFGEVLQRLPGGLLAEHLAGRIATDLDRELP
ncbi:MAG: SufD family Fe-S cluster assembly protein [Actinomycetota bacterium]